MRRYIIPDVVDGQVIAALPKTATVADAARFMREREISAILVMDGDTLDGIFTVRDVARKVAGKDLGLDTKLADVMTADPETIAAEELPLRGLRQMHDGGFRHLPVLADGKVVGVISRRDFFLEDEKLLEQETALWEKM